MVAADSTQIIWVLCAHCTSTKHANSKSTDKNSQVISHAVWMGAKRKRKATKIKLVCTAHMCTQMLCYVIEFYFNFTFANEKKQRKIKIKPRKRLFFIFAVLRLTLSFTNIKQHHSLKLKRNVDFNDKTKELGNENTCSDLRYDSSYEKRIKVENKNKSTISIRNDFRWWHAFEKANQLNTESWMCLNKPDRECEYMCLARTQFSYSFWREKKEKYVNKWKSKGIMQSRSSQMYASESHFIDWSHKAKNRMDFAKIA